MNISAWLAELPQFFILFPCAVSCYLPANHQMRYTTAKTAVLCGAVLIPYSLLGSLISVVLQIDANFLLLPSLPVFFLLYRQTVKLDLSRTLAIYIGVCAIQTFPAQFAYAFDAYLYPLSGAANFSTEAAFFQLILSCLLTIAFIYPACNLFSWAIDPYQISKLWYFTLMPSSTFLILNLLVTPISYGTLQAGRLFYLFPILELCAMVLLISIYVSFYQVARILIKQTHLEKRSQLLEVQSHQYRVLQTHMRQTAQLRHDFRHSVHLLTTLAEQGDLESIRVYLAKYESRLAESVSLHYCNNAALNALFGYYHEMADSAGIQMNWNIHLPDPLTISELDMASLLGNLMENAITACQTLPEEQRYFGLTTEIRQEHCLYIVSTNSFNGYVKKSKEGYRSTKHNGEGTGLASIAAVAEKYNGSVRISNNDKEFFVDVMIKI